MSHGIDLSAISPASFARTIRDTPDDQLRDGMSRPEGRSLVLGGIFLQMAEHLDRERAAGTDAVVHWLIGGREDGGRDLYVTTVRDGRMTISRDAGEPPRLTLTLDAVDFLKLLTDNASGPRMFMFGKLKLQGDLMFATRLQQLFRMPDLGS